MYDVSLLDYISIKLIFLLVLTLFLLYNLFMNGTRRLQVVGLTHFKSKFAAEIFPDLVAKNMQISFSNDQSGKLTIHNISCQSVFLSFFKAEPR